MRNQTGNTNKKASTASKHSKTEEKHKILPGQKERSNIIRRDERNKSEVTGKRRKTKKIPNLDQTKHTKQDIPKQRKQILPASKGKIEQNMGM